MNFFERQDSARASSKRLTFFFICGVLATAVLIHIVVSFGVFLASGGGAVSTDANLEAAELENVVYPTFSSCLFNPGSFAFIFVIVSAIIGLGSLFKISQLNQLGPDGIATDLGGTPVTSSSTGARERRLYNVVEEIALSSGAPMPHVYILDQEQGINACAIGVSPEKAAVCVTRGALDVLNRDELQGVVAHEFSHIVNNDVKLNTRLIGVLFGLELIAMIAFMVLRTFQYSAFSYSCNSRSDGDGDSRRGGVIILVIILVCLAIGIIGSAGAFFGSLIRAAVSRQREYLADASAVQFTRNPGGIAGALKKIGALGAGSKLVSKNAYGASHMFFSNVFSGNFLQSLYQTHPPLVDRIRAIEPEFDGNFPKTIQVNDWGDSNESATPAEPRFKFGGVAAGFADDVAPSGFSVGTGQKINVKPDVESSSFPFLEGVKLDADADVSSDLSGSLNDTASARALFYALLFDKNVEIRTRQLTTVRRNSDSKVIAKSIAFQQTFLNTGDFARILAAKKIQAYLKTLERNDYETFRSTVLELCGADGMLDIFEYAVQASVIRELDVRFGKSRGVQTKFQTFAEISEAFVNALSFLVAESYPSNEDAVNAFKRGANVFSNVGVVAPLGGLSLGDFTRALNFLAQANAELKRDVMKAFCLCVTYDGRINEREAFLLETCGAALGTPTPDWNRLSR